MSLENVQYDAIMREYDRRQRRDRRMLEERRTHAYQQIPRLKEIQDAIAAASAQRVHSLLSGKAAEAAAAYEKRMEALSRERRLLLSQNGFPPDHLEMSFQCPECQDTGYVDGEKCACFRKLAADMLCQQYDPAQRAGKENFALFSFSCYSDKIIDENTGKTPLEHARSAVEIARGFISRFEDSAQNLFIYGDTGVGKTFLSRCIAHEISDKAHSVLYFPSYDLFDLLAKDTFSKGSGGGEVMGYVLDCDLLIIDDLGTELTNSFVSSQLFQIVNERILRERSTMISSNLALEAFPGLYSTRTFSRIIQYYRFINLIGEDIRTKQSAYDQNAR